MSDRLRLVLLSFLMLFLELALIRWLGSIVVYLSYFSNFVLLGSFLGIGLGFLRAGARVDLSRYAPVALAAMVLFVWRFPVEINRDDRDLLFFGGDPTGLPMWVMLPLVFVGTAFVMMTVGEAVARTFGRFEPLDAYRLDILGSILGIAAFTALSFLRSPSLAWGVVVTLLFAVTLERPSLLWHGLPLLGILGVLLVETLSPNVSWSPYYKITTTPIPGTRETLIKVNGIPHQAATEHEDRARREPVYLTPYELGRGNPGRVLVIGAGNGNDVAEALRHGATHVDAVEIDPRLQQIGSEVHPQRPYDDPRVTVHIDDGRAFLEQSRDRYDMILLALPDSLTLVSGQSSLRLESYLFTREALESAREHLAPGGTFTMYNYYREDWLRDRYARSLVEVFGHAPCQAVHQANAGLVALTVSSDGKPLACPQTWVAAGPVPVPSTDDHPFPYLREAAIPAFYLMALGLVLLASTALVRLVGGPLRSMGGYLDLFCMGVAFLLLETKNVVQFALLFGTTWFVNALVFSGVLLSVYLAVELARRVRLPRPAILYVGLLVSLAVGWAVPLSDLLALARPIRFAAAVALAFAPIFFANLIFAQRFADVASSTTAFGANLLGAMVGGVLEYTALLLGYRNLLAVVAIFYAAAYLIGRATWMRRGEAPAHLPELVKD